MNARSAVRACLLTAALWCALPAPAPALVLMSSGSTREEQTDVWFAAGPNLSMTIMRIYNSNSLFAGMFGVGWESRYEEYLQAYDGQVVVFEFGGGAANVFKADTQTGSTTGPDVLLAGEQYMGNFASKSEQQAAANALTSARRYIEADRLRRMGFNLNAAPPPIGSTFVSDQFGLRTVTRYADGYQRNLQTFDEFFDLSGNLRRVWTPDGAYIALSRDANGQLTAMNDGKGHRLRFVYSAAHLARIATGSSAVRYKHSATGDLTQSIQPDGEIIDYTYDTNHYLTKIRYSGKTKHRGTRSMIFSAQDGTIQQVTKLDGSTLRYAFETDKSGNITSGTVVLRKKNGQTVMRGAYDGYGNLLSVTPASGPSLSATYDENNNPITIQQGLQTLHITWDQQGGATAYKIDGVGDSTNDPDGAIANKANAMREALTRADNTLTDNDEPLSS